MVPVTQSSYPRGLWTRMHIYISIPVHINFRKLFQQHSIILHLRVRPRGNKTWEKKGSLNEVRGNQDRKVSLVLTGHISIPSVPSVVLCTLSDCHLLQRGTDLSPEKQRLAKQNLKLRVEASSVFLNSSCAVCSRVDHQMLPWTRLWRLGATEQCLPGRISVTFSIKNKSSAMYHAHDQSEPLWYWEYLVQFLVQSGCSMAVGLHAFLFYTGLSFMVSLPCHWRFSLQTNNFTDHKGMS